MQYIANRHRVKYICSAYVGLIRRKGTSPVNYENMKLYVEAKSKAALNRRLQAGEKIWGTNYSIFGGGGQYVLDYTLPNQTMITIYSLMDGSGNPVGKSYGQWKVPPICSVTRRWSYGTVL
jgi:hypothetical protein